MAPPKLSTAAGPVRGSIRQRHWAQLSRGLYIPRASANVLSEALRGWELVLPDVHLADRCGTQRLVAPEADLPSRLRRRANRCSISRAQRPARAPPPPTGANCYFQRLQAYNRCRDVVSRGTGSGLARPSDSRRLGVAFRRLHCGRAPSHCRTAAPGRPSATRRVAASRQAQRIALGISYASPASSSRHPCRTAEGNL